MQPFSLLQRSWLCRPALCDWRVVVAVAVAPDDPSIRAAAGIAIAAEEDLVIVHAHEENGDDTGTRKLAADTGLTIKQVFTGKASRSDSAACVEAFRHVEERLV